MFRPLRLLLPALLLGGCSSAPSGLERWEQEFAEREALRHSLPPPD
jgi:hypothetical protein